MNRRALFVALGAALVAAAGCWSRSPREIVVYTALDAEFSQPVFDDFTAQTGTTVSPKYDAESTKTVGLAQAILAEQARPRCDVFWNNEVLHTVRLARAGVLEPYQSPRAAAFPEMYRSPDGMWCGFAARARVLVVNTKLLRPGDRPTSILDFADPKWKGQGGMAKPLFGTTATHAACLFAVWGDDRAKEFFREVKANQTKILSGNKQVALDVAAGHLAFGLTDTDDAIIEIEKGLPVEIVYPDQGDGGLGTLFIPNTVAIVRGAANRKAAEGLVDYLLSPEVEAKLAAGPSAQIPLAKDAMAKPRVATPATVFPMEVDFGAAADCWERAGEFLRSELLD